MKNATTQPIKWKWGGSIEFPFGLNGLASLYKSLHAQRLDGNGPIFRFLAPQDTSTMRGSTEGGGGGGGVADAGGGRWGQGFRTP